MRKLKLQVQMSIDGFISGPNGEMDWLNFNWSDDLKAYVTEITAPVSTILLGRKLAQGFIPHWTAALEQPIPEEGAQKFVETPKVVFSKTILTSEWDNTSIAGGELSEEIKQLKSQEGGDIIVYGGGTFVSSLIKEQLIDELNLFVNPAVLGKGMPIFQEATSTQQYKLASSRQFECGIIVLTYNRL